MCKIGILAISLDLCDSAFQRISNLGHCTVPTLLSILPSCLDLVAHALALCTLVLCASGRVNRQATGRVVAPILAIKFAGELDAALWRNDGRVSVWAFVRDFLVVAKALVFVINTSKLALGRDKSYVGPDEWFPGDRNCHSSGEGPPRVVVVECGEDERYWHQETKVKKI